VQIRARRIGEDNDHPEGAMADMRKAVMRACAQQDRHDRLDWRYGGTAAGRAARFLSE
jgi:hypothetical protein